MVTWPAFYRDMCYHFLPSSVCENSMRIICYHQCMEKPVKLTAKISWQIRQDFNGRV